MADSGRSIAGMKLTLLILAISGTWAQRPDVAGKWKLDLTQSKQLDGTPLTLNRDFALTISTYGDKLVWQERLTYPEGAHHESTNAFAPDYDRCCILPSGCVSFGTDTRVKLIKERSN